MSSDFLAARNLFFDEGEILVGQQRVCSEVELREEMYQLIDPGCKTKLVSILNEQLVSFFFFQ